MAKPRAQQFEELRKDIDRLNRELLRLLNQRATLAKDVARIKSEMHEGADKSDVRFYRPEREAQILQHMSSLNAGPLTNTSVSAIFREIISACLALERRYTVAYLGPRGTFTEEAAKFQFGSSVKAKPQGSITDIFAEVEADGADYGVVPAENSTEGMVTHTLDSFLTSSLQICAEIVLPIRHHLMAQPDLPRKQIQWVSAHEQTLAQCRRWLERCMPAVEQIPVFSNGEAARLATERAGTAAIAGEAAAVYYGLKVVERGIQDRLDNTTRFLVLGKQQVDPCGRDKTAIIVSVADKPGALHRLLALFKRAKINLTRLDTRPSQTEKWAYHFFMEFEGHEQEPHIHKLLGKLATHSISLKRLGSYPAGDTEGDPVGGLAGEGASGSK